MICRASLCAAGALLLTHCTGEAYLGAIPRASERATLQPNAGSAGEMPPPPSAAGRGGTAAEAAAAPDGGPHTGDASMSNDDDAGRAFATQGPCIQQPSFEGLAAGALLGIANAPTPWAACYTLQDNTYSAPLCVNETTLVNVGQFSAVQLLPRARDGSTYLYLDSGWGGKGQSTSQMLCDTLRAGQTYGFAVDLISLAADIYQSIDTAPGELQVFLSPDGCNLNDGPLWVSPPLSAAWTRHCVLLTPARDAKALMFRLPLDALGRSAIGIDDIRLEPGCGAP